MPYCACASCKSSTNKGFRLFAFPKDKIKREKWRQNCGRGPDWQPGDNHKLCETHFDDSQFETRALTHNGNRKLKPCAVPTIFPDASNSKKATKNKFQSKTASTKNCKLQKQSLKKPSAADKHEKNNQPEVTEAELSGCQRLVDASTSTEELEQENSKSETNIYAVKMERLLNKVISQCTTIRQLQRKLLKAKRQLNVQFANVNKIFTQDQLKALTYSTKGRFEWSEETIKRSVQVRLACGPKGYNYLVSSGFPFPSYRTLCSRAETPKQPKVLEFRLENLEIVEPTDDKSENPQQHLYEIDLQSCLPCEMNSQQIV